MPWLQFVLNETDHVSLAQATVIVNQNLGTINKEMPLLPHGRIGEASEHKVNDVLDRVVVTPGDVNLLPENLVVITMSLSASSPGPKSEPAPDSVRFMVPDQTPALIFGKYALFKLWTCVCRNRECRPELKRLERKGHIRRVPHLTGCCTVKLRQALPSMR